MTTTESSAGLGPSRGRVPNALVEGKLEVAASVPGIDPELAAMLDREVRAGAPPIESIKSISLPAESPVLDEKAAAGSDVRAAKGVPFSARGVVFADDEAIDWPSLTVESPPIQTPLPVTPAPMRIGTVIIDGAPAPAGTATAAVGPAGELIVSEQSVVPTIIVSGGRDVLPPGPRVRPPIQPVPVPQPLVADQRTIIINRLNEVRDTGWQRALHQQIDELYKQVTRNSAAHRAAPAICSNCSKRRDRSSSNHPRTM